jgi:adenylate cyclase
MTEPSKAVFLSYTSQDAESARRICEALRTAGIEVWFDQSELRGGDVWDASIRKQIKTCALFIPVISRNTHAREEGYFRLEWKLAVDRSHLMTTSKTFLLPVAIDDTRDDDEQVPDKFKEVQWSRLPRGQTPPAFVERITRLLSPEAAAHAPAEARSPATAVPHAVDTGRQSASISPVTSRQTQRLLLVIAAVAVIGVSYFAVDKLVLSKRPAAAAQTSVAANQPGPPAQSAMPEKSIAVLPFVDLSEKKDQEYFADGMAEEILNQLVKIPGLTVIGRTSSFQFKGKNEDLRSIGTKLNAAYVLEGSVRKAGDQVRITAQLINTRTGAHEWSETYDRHIGDVLKLQDAIALAVARELQLTVAAAQFNSRSTMTNADAYDLVLRGRHAADRFDKDGLEEAVALFQQALDRDPTSADAAAGLAYAYYNLGAYDFLAPEAAYGQSRRAAAIALKLDPRNASARWTLGAMHFIYDWNWVDAEQEFQQVATVAPGTGDALNGKAWLSLVLGRWDEGLSQIKAALARDPLNPDSYECLAWLQMARAHLPEAEDAMRRALDIRPTYAWGHFMIGLALLESGDPRAALLEIQQEQQEGAQLSGLSMVYHALGRAAAGDNTLARLIKEQAANEAFQIASVYAFRGDSDEAMRWLERAYAQRDGSLFLIKGYLPLKSVSADPRFKAFLRKMNLPE